MKPDYQKSICNTIMTNVCVRFANLIKYKRFLKESAVTIHVSRGASLTSVHKWPVHVTQWSLIKMGMTAQLTPLTPPTPSPTPAGKENTSATSAARLSLPISRPTTDTQPPGEAASGKKRQLWHIWRMRIPSWDRWRAGRDGCYRGVRGSSKLIQEHSSSFKWDFRSVCYKSR